MNNRYQSQEKILPKESTKALSQSSVLVVGAGGLGCGLLPYLAGAGVGKIGVMDFDTICLSNLSRQILFKESQVGDYKATKAIEALKMLNSSLDYVEIKEKLTDKNLRILDDYDLIIEATDSAFLPYLLNDYLASLKKPWVYASSIGYRGFCALFEHKKGSACFRCVFPHPSASLGSCEQQGVIGPLVGMLSCAAASLSLLLLSREQDKAFAQKLWHVDLSTSHTSVLDIKPKKSCQCQTHQKQRVEKIEISYQEALAFDAVFIDVRTKEEFLQGHLQGALHIPVESIKEQKNLPKKLVLYCNKGIKSLYARSLLKQNGFDGEVYSLEGGAEKKLLSCKGEAFDF